MESTLHRQLKDRYGPARGGRGEVIDGAFRADAIGPDGAWIEVQSGPLGPLRGKLARLLSDRDVIVVKPLVLERRIIRRTRLNGPDLSARRSPRRMAPADFFDDLVGLARSFPHPRLRMEVLGVSIDEIRLPLRRWPGYRVADRLLREIRETWTLETAADLWQLLPEDLPDPFTTLDLANVLDRPIWLAQRIAYCLRHSGAAGACGKIGNRIIYQSCRAELARQVMSDPISPR